MPEQTGESRMDTMGEGNDSRTAATVDANAIDMLLVAIEDRATSVLRCGNQSTMCSTCSGMVFRIREDVRALKSALAKAEGRA